MKVAPRYPARGRHDAKPTPEWLYSFITRDLGFYDACRDPSSLDFLHDEPPRRRVYCNPPFSRKSSFVDRAIELAGRGYVVLLLLPGDYSTSWFRKLYHHGKADLLFAMGRLHGRGARYPSLLALLHDYPRSGVGPMFVEPRSLKRILRSLVETTRP